MLLHKSVGFVLVWFALVSSFHVLFHYINTLHHNLLSNSCIDEHLDYFEFLAIMNKAAISIFAEAFFLILSFCSFWVNV